MEEDEYDCSDCVFCAMCTPFEKLSDNCMGDCNTYTDYSRSHNYSWKRYVDNLFDYEIDGDTDALLLTEDDEEYFEMDDEDSFYWIGVDDVLDYVGIEAI